MSAEGAPEAIEAIEEKLLRTSDVEAQKLFSRFTVLCAVGQKQPGLAADFGSK